MRLIYLNTLNSEHHSIDRMAVNYFL